MRNTTIFKKNIFIGTKDNDKEYLIAPSWDCEWYWGFGYLRGKRIHHHVNTINKDKNLFDSIKEYYGETLNKKLKDNETLWKFCELMQTFYILKDTAGLLHRGGSHYTTNPLSEQLKNPGERARINEVLMPLVFDEIYKLFI